MIPTFMRFYSYSLDGVLDMPARSYFALMNAYYKVTASERIARIIDTSAAQSENGSKIVSELEQQEAGVDDILEQARVLRNIKGKK